MKFGEFLKKKLIGEVTEPRIPGKGTGLGEFPPVIEPYMKKNWRISSLKWKEEIYTLDKGGERIVIDAKKGKILKKGKTPSKESEHRKDIEAHRKEIAKWPAKARAMFELPVEKWEKKKK